MGRKNKKGRPPRTPDIKEQIIALRDDEEKNLSFTEIGELLDISRQLVQYHYSHK